MFNKCVMHKQSLQPEAFALLVVGATTLLLLVSLLLLLVLLLVLRVDCDS